MLGQQKFSFHVNSFNMHTNCMSMAITLIIKKLIVPERLGFIQANSGNYLLAEKSRTPKFWDLNI